MSVADDKETLGQEFRRIRKYLGLTQDQAAEICGVSKQSITIWERDKRQFNHKDTSALIRQALVKLKRRRKWIKRKQ